MTSQARTEHLRGAIPIGGTGGAIPLTDRAFARAKDALDKLEEVRALLYDTIDAAKAQMGRERAADARLKEVDAVLFQIAALDPAPFPSIDVESLGRKMRPDDSDAVERLTQLVEEAHRQGVRAGRLSAALELCETLGRPPSDVTDTANLRLELAKSTITHCHACGGEHRADGSCP